MVFEKIKEIVAEQLGIDSDIIKMETDFRKDLQADSLDLFQIINDLEEAFGVTIDDVESIVTVADAVQYAEKHGNAK